MKKIIIVVLAVTVLVSGIAYLRYTRTPQYSLLQVGKSVVQHDWNSFQKYVDVDSVASNLVDQVVATLTAEEDDQQDMWGIWGGLGQGLSMLMKPQLVSSVKQQVKQYVEGKHSEESNDSENSSNSSDTDTDTEVFSHSLLGMLKSKNNLNRAIAYINKNGKTANVGFKIPLEEYNTSAVLEIKMRDKGNYWQVTEMDFSKFEKKLDDLETQRIAKLNKPIIDKIKRTLVLSSVQKSTSKSGDDWFPDKKVIFTLKFKNNSEKEVKEYKGILICKTSDGKVLKQLPFDSNNSISPGQTGNNVLSIDVDDLLSSNSDDTLYNTPQSDLKIDVNVEYIKFGDGNELKLYKKGQNPQKGGV